MLKIETDKLKVLAELRTVELTYPFWKQETHKRYYKIMCDAERIYITSLVVEGPFQGKLGSIVFIQRENLKQVIQAIEDWLNPDLKISVNQLEVVKNADDFGVSFSYPDRFDVTRWLNLANAREAEIDGSFQRAWGLNTSIETGYKLIEELKKVDVTISQTENQRLIAR